MIFDKLHIKSILIINSPTSMKPVKNQGIVIDGSMHQNEAYVQKHSSHPSTETFPKKTS